MEIKVDFKLMVNVLFYVKCVFVIIRNNINLIIIFSDCLILILEFCLME